MAKQSEQVQEIPISELFPFKDHPFRVLDDEAMQRTVESISQFGVLAPAIARPRPEGGYEIIAGHRRLHASQLLGLETMPVLVRQMDDDTAIITMVDSNLQRETMLPSERARAYKMKMDAMARRAGRPSKENSGQLDRNFLGKETREITAKRSLKPTGRKSPSIKRQRMPSRKWAYPSCQRSRNCRRSMPLFWSRKRACTRSTGSLEKKCGSIRRHSTIRRCSLIWIESVKRIIVHSRK